MDNLTFRAWDDLNKKWFMDSPRGFSLTGECVLFGEWGHFFDEFLFCKNGKEPKHLIIEQYTGKEIDGVELFQGDIVEYTQCLFNTTSDKWPRKTKEIKWDKIRMAWNLFETGAGEIDIKIIGNIHEQKKGDE